MRGPLIALACGLAAAAALLLALHGGSGPVPLPPPPPAPVATVPASAIAPEASPQPPPPVPAAQAPAEAPPAAPTVVAAVPKPAPQASPPVHSTFALSSDHRTLIQGTLLAAADLDRLESEPRDDAWATETEQLIRQELARHGGAVDFDVIAVDCRQTLCAIQAFSNGENGQRRWVEAVDELYRDALANVFDSVNTAFPTQGSSRSPVLTFLHRKPGATTR
jgi:hypothetical protein